MNGEGLGSLVTQPFIVTWLLRRKTRQVQLPHKYPGVSSPDMVVICHKWRKTTHSLSRLLGERFHFVENPKYIITMCDFKTAMPLFDI